MRRARQLGLTLALGGAALVAGCGDQGDSPARTMGTGGSMSGGEMSGGSMSGGEMLGGSARTRVLARARVTPPESRPLAWTAFEVRLAPGRRLTHRHAFSFVYQRRGRQLLRSPSGPSRLGTGRADAVGAGATHTHRAPARSESTFWEVLLAPTGTAAPAPGSARRVFRSRPLQGVPRQPRAVFVEVALPRGRGMTGVHSHPGPELIYTSEGMFTYQGGAKPPRMMMPGDTASLAADRPVQKRDPGAAPARFLSWFLVDPRKPFASPASFARS